MGIRPSAKAEYSLSVIPFSHDIVFADLDRLIRSRPRSTQMGAANPVRGVSSQDITISNQSGLQCRGNRERHETEVTSRYFTGTDTDAS